MQQQAFITNLLEVGPGGRGANKTLADIPINIDFKAVELDEEKVDYSYIYLCLI